MLQHQVQIFSVLVNIVQTQHVLMLDQLHDGNLPLHLLQHWLAQLLLVDDLDGHLLPQDTMSPKLDQPWNKKTICYNFQIRFHLLIFKGFYCARYLINLYQMVHRLLPFNLSLHFQYHLFRGEWEFLFLKVWDSITIKSYQKVSTKWKL